MNTPSDDGDPELSDNPEAIDRQMQYLKAQHVQMLRECDELHQHIERMREHRAAIRASAQDAKPPKSD